jgi:outer membrane autotransporter protein
VTLRLNGIISDSTGSPAQLHIVDSSGSFSGITVLAGNNSYSGGTLVSDTALQVRNNNAAGSGTVTLSDALFQLGGNSNLIIANNFQIDNTPFGSFFDNNNRTLTLNGNITDGNGPGAVEFENNGFSGKFVLNGTNTYTGGTTICSCSTVQLGDSTHTASLVGAVTVEGEFDVVNTNTSGIASITNEGLTKFSNGTSASSIAIGNTGFGELVFVGNSTTAGNATITNDGALVSFGAIGGTDQPTAGNATITNKNGGEIDFNASSTAGNAAITTDTGAQTLFFDHSTGGNAQLIANGTGVVDFSQTTGPNGDGQISAGSIDGSGTFYIGPNNTLTVGGNNLSTNVSGLIADYNPCLCGGTGPGALIKVGTGTLILSSDDTYTGGTTVEAGTLQLGTVTTAGNIVGPVTVNANADFNLVNSTIPGVTTILNNGFMQVSNASTLGSAMVTGSGGIEFLDSSSAGSATITYTSLASPLRFFDTSTAGSSNITNSGFVQFADNSTAGTATITNNLGLDFFNSSSAGSATITNGPNGLVDFQNSSTAGSANITNNGNWAFSDTTTAGNATIVNNQSLSFFSSSTAGNAAITNNGFVFFGQTFSTDTPTAGSATITNNSGGETDFDAYSTAGTATIVTKSGGLTFFNDHSTGGQAQFTTDAGGAVDFSNTIGPNSDGKITAASIAGAGNYYLGANQLTLGGTNLSMMVPGVISDCGAGGTACFSGATGGSLVMTGTGTLTLTGTNTYTGATTIAGATLVLSGTGSIAASSGVVDGGTFDISALTSGGTTIKTLSGAGAVALGGNTLTLSNASSAFSGGISGTGGLTLTAGMEILSGSNAYTGATAINGGTLEVDGSIANSTSVTVASGAKLTGAGVVDPPLATTTIMSGATLAPGNAGNPTGMMTIGGNLAFQSGATYLVQVTPTTAASVNVGGTASLTGTVGAAFATGSYISKVYTILTAGSVSGTFGSLANLGLPNNFSDSLSYDTAHAYLNLTLNFTPPTVPVYAPLNTNQQNVASTLVNYFNTTGGIPTAFGTLSSVQLTQADGENATDAQKGAFQLMSDFLNLMLDPSSGGGTGGASASGNSGAPGFAPEQDAALPPEIALAYNSMLTKAPPKPQSFDQRWTAWGSAFGGTARINGDPAAGSNNVTASDYGFAGGMNYHLSPDTLVGFAFAGGGTNWSLAQNLGTGRSDAFQAGLYAKTHSGPAYLSAALAFANHWFTTDRTSALGDRLEAKFQGQGIGGRLEAGYRYGLPSTNYLAGITPYAAVQAQSFHTPTYAEADLTGGGFGVTYNAQNATDTRSELGVRADDLTMIGAMPLILRGRLAWAHDWISNSALGAAFQTLPGTSFIVNGAAPPKDSVLTTAGAELRMTANWSLLGKFDGEFGNGAQTYAGTGTLRYSW